jgi:DNA-binding response OmpR family regulator
MTQPQTSEPRGNILIVDDTPANLRLLGAMLSEQGYKTRSVVNGEMALTAARSAPPDLILLDINMPDMSGYDVCRALKADERTRAIPVIFVSALDEALDKVKAFDVGGVDYLTKPVQFEEVIVRVSTHLKLHRLQQASGGAERFVPPALAKLLGRPGSAALQPGDSASIKAALLVAVIRATSTEEQLEPGACTALMNRFLGPLGMLAGVSGGFVERWRMMLAVAVFPAGLDQALVAAQGLRAHIQAQGQQPGVASVGIGLCSRSLTLSVIGDERQLQVVWLDGAEEAIAHIELAVHRSAEAIAFIDI